jgi:hypothetical protein
LWETAALLGQRLGEYGPREIGSEVGSIGSEGVRESSEGVRETLFGQRVASR